MMSSTNRLFAAADAKETRRSEHAPTPSATPIDIRRGSRYALQALQSECEQLAATPIGQRDHAINRAAYNMGTLVGAGLLDQQQVITALWDAARATGQPDDEIANALRNGTDRNANTGGFEQGKANPRPLPDESFSTPPPVTVLGEPLAEIVSVDIGDKVRDRLPILDWHAVWDHEDVEDWIVEPLLPARRLVALYSAPKVGKSLLMLELAVAICRGTPVLGTRIDRPRRVLYVDFENDPYGDVRERLRAMGVGPDDLTNLCYLSFPTIAYLDTEGGSLELLAAAEVYDCEVVVIDTVSRSVGGDENENDTWLNFYRHTGLKLKQAQKALIRLDHAGKDEAKGQRGGSAKEGDVDAVWRMSKVNDTTFRLDCTHNRMPVHEKTLVLHRKSGPLRHAVDALGAAAALNARVEDCQRALDAAGAGNDISNREALDLLRAVGNATGKGVVEAALRDRKCRIRPSLDFSGTPDEISAVDTSPGALRDRGL